MSENLVPKAFELCAADNIDEFKQIVPGKVKINAKVFLKLVFLTYSIKMFFYFFTEDTSYLRSRKSFNALYSLSSNQRSKSINLRYFFFYIFTKFLINYSSSFILSSKMEFHDQNLIDHL